GRDGSSGGRSRDARHSVRNRSNRNRLASRWFNDTSGDPPLNHPVSSGGRRRAGPDPDPDRSHPTSFIIRRSDRAPTSQCSGAWTGAAGSGGPATPTPFGQGAAGGHGTSPSRSRGGEGEGGGASALARSCGGPGRGAGAGSSTIATRLRGR